MRTGLRLLVAAAVLCGPSAVAAPPAPSAEATVVITMHHSRFHPAALQVPRGTTVRFVVRNLDPIDHELILGDAAVQAHHEVGTDPAHPGHVPGEITVPAGEERATVYTFTDPGVVLMGCHLPGHWAYGMRGAVRVT